MNNRSQFRSMLQIKKAMKAGDIALSVARVEIAKLAMDKGETEAEAEATSRIRWNQWVMELRGL